MKKNFLLFCHKRTVKKPCFSNPEKTKFEDFLPNRILTFSQRVFIYFQRLQIVLQFFEICQAAPESCNYGKSSIYAQASFVSWYVS